VSHQRPPLAGPGRYDCFPCGERFDTAVAHMIHTASCPAIGQGAVTRAVHCWACAAEIDLREGADCPRCGRTYTEGTDHG
jgi:DNA-directed RNA polymerase subunit RPC12/RpoP